MPMEKHFPFDYHEDFVMIYRKIETWNY